MAILYLTEQQAWVAREGDCLIVHIPERAEDGSKTRRERKMTVPLFKIEEVIVLGEITITTPALAALLETKIPVTYLSKYGRYLGHLSPELTKNSLLRLAQHAAHADPKQRHLIAQRFVVGKLRNMRTVLMRYNRLHPDPLISEQTDHLKRCINAAEHTNLKFIDSAITESEIDRDPRDGANRGRCRQDERTGTAPRL